MFGISLSESDLIIDLTILLALIINVMVIGKALELISELYERINTFLDYVIPIDSADLDQEKIKELLETQGKTVKKILWEDDWP